MFRLYFFFLALILIPEYSFAIETEAGEVATFGEYISQIWAWATQIIFSVSVVTLIVGGIMYMMARGAEEKLDSAKQVISGSLISTALMLLSGILFAVLNKPTEGLQGEATLTDATFVLENIANILLGVVGGVSVVVLIYNGIEYMLSSGDYEKLDAAKRGLIFSLTGLAISLTAYFVVGWVITIWT